jgi:branched-chain amino acid transport system ATP-binding protein
VKRLVIERGISVLFTEHSMDVVFAFADRIIVLARGRLIADGDATSIRNDAQVREVYFAAEKHSQNQGRCHEYPDVVGRQSQRVLRRCANIVWAEF